MSNTKKKERNEKIILFIKIVFFAYITLRTSYAIVYDNALEKGFLLLSLKRLWPLPFKLCFSPYSLIWIGIYIILYAWYVVYKNKPKADAKWKDIEHGSNEFQNKEERKDFLEKCTDKIYDFTDDEINNILNFLGEVKVEQKEE